jgi:hypothetical protein
MKRVAQNAGSIVVFDHHPDGNGNCRDISYTGVCSTRYSSTVRLILSYCVIPEEIKGNAELFALMTENDLVNSAKLLGLAVKKMIFSETSYGKQTASRLRTARDLLVPKCDKWDAVYKSIPACIKEDEEEREAAAKLATHVRSKTVNDIIAQVVYLTIDSIDKVFANLPSANALIGWKLDATGNMVRCRIRSRDGSAYKIAKYLGGSGHANAAAADMTLENFFTNVMLGDADAVKPQKESPPIPVTLVLSDPPAKKRILRPSGLPLEKNKDVLQAFSVIREAYNSPLSDFEMKEYYGGVTSVQNCLGQARSLSKELLGKDRPFMGYLYVLAYNAFGQDFDKTDSMIRKNFAKPQTKAVLEEFKPRSPVDPRILRILIDLVLSETHD